MKTKLQPPKRPNVIRPNTWAEIQREKIDRRYQIEQVITDGIKGLGVGILAILVIWSVYALAKAQREQRAAEIEAETAHADSVAFFGGTL